MILAKRLSLENFAKSAAANCKESRNSGRAFILSEKQRDNINIVAIKLKY